MGFFSGFFGGKKKLAMPGGDGQGGGAPKTLRIHFSRSGSFWVDRHELVNDPEIRRLCKEAKGLVKKPDKPVNGDVGRG